MVLVMPKQKLPENLRRKPVNLRLPPWLAEWLSENADTKAGKSASKLIEKALIATYQIEPPKV